MRWHRAGAMMAERFLDSDWFPKTMLAAFLHSLIEWFEVVGLYGALPLTESPLRFLKAESSAVLSTRWISGSCPIRLDRYMWSVDSGFHCHLQPQSILASVRRVMPSRSAISNAPNQPNSRDHTYSNPCTWQWKETKYCSTFDRFDLGSSVRILYSNKARRRAPCHLFHTSPPARARPPLKHIEPR